MTQEERDRAYAEEDADRQAAERHQEWVRQQEARMTRRNPIVHSIKRPAREALRTYDDVSGQVYKWTAGLPSTIAHAVVNPDWPALIRLAQTERNVHELARLHKYAIGMKNRELQDAVEARCKQLNIKLSTLTDNHPRKWNPSLALVQAAAGAGEQSGREWPAGRTPSATTMDKEFRDWLKYRENSMPEIRSLSAFDRKQLRGAFFRGVRQGFTRMNPRNGGHFYLVQHKPSGKFEGKYVTAEEARKAAEALNRRTPGARENYTYARYDYNPRESDKWFHYTGPTSGPAVQGEFVRLIEVRGDDYVVEGDAGEYWQAPSRWFREHVRRKGNPAETADALYESFHGRAPEQTVEIREEVHEHEHLSTLGMLRELVIDTVSGLRATITFDKEPFLASSEDGKQLYIEGGDQELDLKALQLDGEEWERDRMMIGQFAPPEDGATEKNGKRYWNLMYRTTKDWPDQPDGEDVDYCHDLGEESDVRPFLEYDFINKHLIISGGQYEIKQPLFGMSPGIEN